MRSLPGRAAGVLRIIGPLAMIVYLTLADFPLFMSYVNRPDFLFGDVRIYYRATEAWVNGMNPWLANNGGILFAAPPPALLLNLPLLPLGEAGAVATWVIASALAAVFLLWRLGLPPWFVLFYPLAEAYFGGSPDIVLAAAIVVSWGWLSAFIKPYCIPAMLSERRWRAVAIAGIVAVVSIPFLPWGEFLASGSMAVSMAQSHPTSALGIPWLMLLTAGALVSLGWPRAFALVVPALFAQQPHYAVFSLLVISRSLILTLAAALPAQGAVAVGVIAYSLIERVRPLRLRQPVDVDLSRGDVAR